LPAFHCVIKPSHGGAFKKQNIVGVIFGHG
jgi:hypothetical protein